MCRTTGKVLSVFVRMILGPVRVDIFTGSRQENDNRQKNLFFSHQSNKAGKTDYCSHFSVPFETTGKLLIVFVRWILGKVRVDVFTGPRRENEVR